MQAGAPFDPSPGPHRAAEHYRDFLAPLYAWTLGGAALAIERGRAELAELGLTNGAGQCALDLGAGFGAHAIPLARAGWRVLAVDSSARLLDELRAGCGAATVTVAQDDLLRFPRHLSEPPELVLCMGDTLAHLEDRAAVTGLVSDVARHAAPGARFVLSLREDPGVLPGTVRRVPVRSDASRQFVCELEYGQDSVRVHDQLHELVDGAWRAHHSTYRKLRLEADWVVQQLEASGFVVQRDRGRHGMLRLDGLLAPRGARPERKRGVEDRRDSDTGG